MGEQILDRPTTHDARLGELFLAEPVDGGSKVGMGRAKTLDKLIF